MNARQKKFCDEYLIDCNATQAAIRAGYSPKTAKSIGNENLTKPDLKAYIDEQLELLHSKRTADAQEVLEYLTSVMRGEHTEQTLQLVGDGVQTITDIDVSAKERLYPGWNMFCPIAALIATLDFKALILVLILIVVDALFYLPFIKVIDKQRVAEEE